MKPIFSPDNLFAWCVASHDGAKRNPEDRAAMLQELGIRGYAWGNRMATVKFLPDFAAEMEALRRHGISLIGRFFPSTFTTEEMRSILDAIIAQGASPQLWICEDNHADWPEGQEALVHYHTARIAPLAKAADAAGMTVALYNHSGWYGDPRNQVAIVESLRSAGHGNVGIAHCLHWSHRNLDAFEEIFALMQPYLSALILNGMTAGTEGPSQIMPVGAGDEDLRIARIIDGSGWHGPLGIINHTEHDAALRLRDNLDGVAWLEKQLRGQDAERPAYRTWPMR